MSFGLVQEQILVTEKEEGYKDALKVCADLGLNIIRIENDEDNDLVHKLWSSGTAWIDGFNVDNEGKWFNTDNNELNYTKWHKGEPNNWQNNQFCIQINFFRDQTWDDESCSGKNRVICYAKQGFLREEIFVTGKNGSFEYAQSYCNEIGLKLIRIENEIENNLIYKIANSNNVEPYWIDGNNVNEKNSWINSDNKTLVYTKWHRNQFNGTQEQNCILGNKFDTNEWAAEDCSNPNAIICIKNKFQAVGE